MVKTMAATNLLNALKVRLGIDTDRRDPQLMQVLTGVVAAAENHIGRKLAVAEYDEQYDGNGKQSLVLRQYPVLTVAEVQIDGRVIDDWRNDNWLMMRLAGFPQGLRNIRVRYTAGFDPLPDDLTDALLQTAAHRLNELDNKGIQSKSLAGESVTFAAHSRTQGIPPAAFAVLEHYRRKY